MEVLCKVNTLFPSFLPWIGLIDKKGGEMRGKWASTMALICSASLCFFFAFDLLTETGADCKTCSGEEKKGISEAETKHFAQGARKAHLLDLPPPAAAEIAQVLQERRRRLVGHPGSYPPRCASKCGRCTPCLPVRVRVPPAGELLVAPATAEYYPEAWLCLCRGRLFSP